MKKFVLLVVFSVTVLLFFSQCSKKFTPYSTQKIKTVSPVSLDGYKKPHLRRGQDSCSALGISISGGGSRAMCFGIGVLLGLEEIKAGKSNLLNEADYFSTVSGGGFAAGYYLSRKNHYASLNKDSVGEFSFNKVWYNSVDYNTLLPNVNINVSPVRNIFYHNTFRPNKRMKDYYNEVRNHVTLSVYESDVQPITLKKFINGIPVDRNIIKKRVKYFNHNSYIGVLTLSDFYIPFNSKQELTLPLLIANGTLFENNARMALVPNAFDSLDWVDLLPKTKLKEKNLILHSENNPNTTNMPIYNVLTASAAFPGVLTQMQGYTKNGDRVRIIDGGVAENFGYKSIFDVFDELSLKNKEVKRKALIVIDASGIGYGSPFSANNGESVISIAARQLYSTLESKYPDAFIEIRSRDSIDKSFNYCHIGITNLIDAGKKDSIPFSFKSKGGITWKELFNEFKLCFNVKYNFELYRMKPSEVLARVNTRWLLYELAAHVTTKLKVTDEERAILVLAGKTCVYLNQNKLKELLKY